MELNRSDLNSSLCEEIEALEAILDETDELNLLPPNEEGLVVITVRIAPLTASDTSRQYVGLHLKMVVHKDNYPEQEIPRQINVFQVRGLDEVKVEKLLVTLRNKSVEFEGMQVLFTLIDECREFLTAHNYPTCPCSICLFHIGMYIFIYIKKKLFFVSKKTKFYSSRRRFLCQNEMLSLLPFHMLWTLFKIF